MDINEITKAISEKKINSSISIKQEDIDAIGYDKVKAAIVSHTKILSCNVSAINDNQAKETVFEFHE